MSEYGLTWERVQDIPITWEYVVGLPLTWENVLDFTRDEILINPNSQNVFVQIVTEEIDRFQKTYTLEYDADVLRLISPAYQNNNMDTNVNKANSHFQVLSNTPGRLKFQCDKEDGGYWSGLNTLICFHQIQPVSTALRLF